MFLSLSLQSSPYSTFSHSLSFFFCPTLFSLPLDWIGETNEPKTMKSQPSSILYFCYPSIFLLSLLFVITWKSKLKGRDFGFPLGQTEDPLISLGLGFTEMAVAMIGCDNLWWVFILYIYIYIFYKLDLWWAMGVCGGWLWVFVVLGG